MLPLELGLVKQAAKNNNIIVNRRVLGKIQFFSVFVDIACELFSYDDHVFIYMDKVGQNDTLLL